MQVSILYLELKHNLHDANILPVPINELPDTTSALEPNLPITILSSLNTSNIGNPVMSLTFIKLPLRLSVIPNNVPALPINDTLPSCNTSNLIEDVALPEKYKCGICGRTET
jgi:hypothetical protein